MSETLNTGEYAALRREIRNKEMGAGILGAIGFGLLLFAAGAAVFAASGGTAAIPIITGLFSAGGWLGGMAAGAAAITGLAGGAMSWKAAQQGIELQMDYDELRARRNAATLSQVMGGKDLTPQQAAMLGTTMAQNQDSHYPQNQRTDGRQWGDVVGKVADTAIVASVANDIAQMSR